MNKNATFKVNGMHCGGCANKIKKQISELKVDHTIDINVESGLIKIGFDSEKSSLSVLKENIIKAGFQVESVEVE